MLGRQIAHYRVVALLGEGGMGAVYEAEDTRLERRVALKFLRSEQASDAAPQERLLREARAASRLNHPCIATVYEVGEAEGTAFIAMELVKGDTLKAVLSRGALPAAQVLPLARQIAEALDAAHRHGVLHRDIKPANIVVDSGGRVKVLDFGIAALAARDAAAGESTDNFITRTAQAVATGTAPYMSPEQLRGEPADARSDIFSFGILLYECLAGRRPFQGQTSIDILHSILRQPPPPLRIVAPELPSDWQTLVERCLAKLPEQRYQTMAEVAAAIQNLSAAGEHEKSIAVLYFENLSGSQEDQYFRDGMTEDIITEISKIRALKVFPRSAVVGYRDKPLTAPQIGQQLQAAYILGGSLRRAGNRLRITAQLIQTHSGHAVWAERYDRQMEDVFAIQDEMAQNIARALEVMLTDTERRAIEKPETADIQAYDYYLRGRQFFHQFRMKGTEFARQMFARAIVLDPNYARAYAGVADCCSFIYMYWEASEANLKEADAASRKALELDPDSAEGHASRGLAISLRKQYQEAHAEFDTAIRLNPRLFEPYYFCARSYLAQGKLAESAEMFEQASRVSPDDYQSPGLLGMVYSGLKQLEKARRCWERSVASCEKHLKLNPDNPRAYYLGAIDLVRLGQREKGLDWARRALEIEPDDTGVLYNVACVYSVAGEIDKSLDSLERGVAAGFGQKDWMINDDDLSAIRNHPRYQEILNRLP